MLFNLDLEKPGVYVDCDKVLTLDKLVQQVGYVEKGVIVIDC